MTPYPEFRVILSDFEWLEGDKRAGRKLRFSFEFYVDTPTGVFRVFQEGWIAQRQPKTKELWVSPPMQRIKNNKLWCNTRISKTAMDIIAEGLEKTTYGPKIGTNPFTNEMVYVPPKPWEEDPSLPELFEVKIDTVVGAGATPLLEGGEKLLGDGRDE